VHAGKGQASQQEPSTVVAPDTAVDAAFDSGLPRPPIEHSRLTRPAEPNELAAAHCTGSYFAEIRSASRTRRLSSACHGLPYAFRGPSVLVRPPIRSDASPLSGVSSAILTACTAEDAAAGQLKIAFDEPARIGTRTVRGDVMWDGEHAIGEVTITGSEAGAIEGTFRLTAVGSSIVHTGSFRACPLWLPMPIYITEPT
jgi:hypothetical protein